MIMKNQILSKRVLGLYVFVLLMTTLLLFPSFSVQAKRKCSGELTGEALKRYGISMTVSGDNAIIKMNAQSANAKKAEFKVTQVNGNAYSENKVLKNGKQIQVATSYVKNGSINEMEIVLKATDEKIDEDFCEGEGNITIKLIFTKGGEPRIERGVVSVNYDDVKPTASNKIDCTGYTTFNDEKELNASTARDWFCRAKNNASKTYTFKATSYDDKYHDSKSANFDDGKTVNGLKCSYKGTYTEDDLKNGGYYRAENRTYIYGVGTYTLTFGNYKYHFVPDAAPTNGSSVSCDVTCEEALTVEYGPPIASKAGLCFEYKVRVTSVVDCHMSKEPTPPEDKYNYCTPTPYCTNANGDYLVHQGGPNEDFDSCIKSCDNGKYTDKCSKKCYNEVYGNSGNSNMSSNTSSGLQDAAIEKIKSKVNKTPPKSSNTFTGGTISTGASFSLGDCMSWNGSSGCYTSGPVWSGSGPGRWYGGSCPAGYDVFEGNGICRHDLGSDHCHDICWWSGCDGQYLNPKFPEKDYENNKKIYKEAVKQCSAAASCTTSTAEFTISVDYKDGKGVKQPLVFPYESNESDKVTSGKNRLPNTSSNKKSTILGYRGCYKSNDGENRYQTEWSFPGTWIHNKTGEISYIPKEDDAWKTQKEKFCIPLDAQDVNRSWWNYYYNKVFGNSSKYSVNTSEYKEECGKSEITKKTSLSSEEVDAINYNIKASAKNFGYFHWNINVKCFYALNSNKIGKSIDSSSGDDKCTLDPDPNSGTPNYRIRSVDLDNLFPATDGSKLTSTASAGRAPGFNWTKYADTTNTNKSGSGYNKNSNYQVEPTKYMQKIQSVGYNVYSDDYLDYEFELTPDVLNKLRSDTKAGGHNYTDFKGDVTSKNNASASYYKSKVIRTIPGAKLPADSGLKCNNIANRGFGTCDNYSVS